MSRPRRPFATLRFEGPGFDDHGLDVRSLRAICEYQDLVSSVADARWRKENPDRERISKGFAAQFAIKMYAVEPGSAVAPLERIQVAEGVLFPPEFDEFDDAADIVTESIDAAARGEPLPRGMPGIVLAEFQRFGSLLAPADRVRVSTQRRAATSCYSTVVRDQLAQWNEPTYEDDIEEVGEIRGADVDKGRYSIRLTDGRKVPGAFAAHDEATVVEALRDHAYRRLRVWGRGVFVTATGALKEIREATRVRFEDEPKPVLDPRPIWEIVEEIGRTVPDAEWDKLPPDASLRFDEYLEGGGSST